MAEKVTEESIRELINAIRHPGANPRLAYKVMMHVRGSDAYTQAQKREIEYQMSNNPNPAFHEVIHRIDSHNPRAKQLLLTREWDDWHNGDGTSHALEQF